MPVQFPHRLVLPGLWRATGDSCVASRQLHAGARFQPDVRPLFARTHVLSDPVSTGTKTGMGCLYAPATVFALAGGRGTDLLDHEKSALHAVPMAGTIA